MKQQDLRAIQPKSYVPKTTNSSHNLGRSPNLLLDRKSPSQPNEVFAGDITYIPMIDGTFLFLATCGAARAARYVQQDDGRLGNR